MSLFRVFVDFSGTRFSVYVKSAYTIERFRRLIVTACKDESAGNLPLSCRGSLLHTDNMTIADQFQSIGTDATIYVGGVLDSRGIPQRVPVRVIAKTQHDVTAHFSVEVNEFVEVGHIKQLIYENLWTKNKTCSEITSLTFEGRQLEDEKMLTEYNIRSGDIVTLIYLASGKTLVPIFIKALAGNILLIFVDPTYTVGHLKSLIYFKDGSPTAVPPSMQRLICGGKQISRYDEKQLSDYGIIKESTVHVVLKLVGGGYSISEFLFTDVKHTPFEIRQPSATDPSYRQFSDGVSSEGVCVNPTCKVYGKKFVCHHGYGVYRVNEDPTRCPECQGTSPRVESFGFSLANVVIRTMPLGLKNQPAEMRTDLSERKGNYACLPYLVLHSSSEDTNKNYEFIEVFSCRLECSITLGEELCSLCSRTLQGSCACNHGLPDFGTLTL